MSFDFTTLPYGTKTTWVKLDPVEEPDTWSFSTTTSSVTSSPTSAAPFSWEPTMPENYHRGSRVSYVRYDHEDGWVFLVLEGDSWNTLVFEDAEDADHFLDTGYTKYIHAKTQLSDWMPNSLRHTGNDWVQNHADGEDPDNKMRDGITRTLRASRWVPSVTTEYQAHMVISHLLNEGHTITELYQMPMARLTDLANQVWEDHGVAKAPTVAVSEGPAIGVGHIAKLPEM